LHAYAWDLLIFRAAIEVSMHKRGLPRLCVGLDSLARAWLIFNVSTHILPLNAYAWAL
ncbi:hypothetical protein PIB30_106329, partial [Stylosanthes scabra]|nr:hypothetical protein [Stylosanthes scabra]